MTDHGLREAIYGHNERDIGQVLENIVYVELLRRGYDVHVGKNDLKEYVLSMDEINRSRKGIKHLNIRKFLLDQNI